MRQHRRRRLAVAVLAGIGIGSAALSVSVAQQAKPGGGAAAQAAPAGGAPNAPAAQPAQQQVPVKQVVLFSSGVGYFEHFGSVRGNGSTELQFKTQQINDILKSLVLQDLDGGQVTTVTYPSQDPLSKTLGSFQINIAANPPLADLLNQLRGAVVSVKTTNAEAIRGTILGVEKKPRPVGKKDDEEVIEVAVLNVVVDGARIVSVALDDVRDLQIEDPQLREELGKALAAVAQARGQDKKPVAINFRGDGERRVRIGYVVETPVWKTSYRLILGEDAAGAKKEAGPAPAGDGKPGEAAKPPLPGQGKLQGWAIVENQTDSDWTDVQLSLVSGRPISFIQDLYQPLYVPRPVVQPELYASLRPQTYEGGMAGEREMEEFAKAEGRDGAQPMRREMASRARSGGRGLAPAAAAPASPMPADAMAATPMEAAKPMDASASVASVASAAKVGELFQYTVGSVSLPRQKSAMIPIVTDAVQIERLSIYNQSVLPKNPLGGARVRNTTDKHLLQGPVTVLDGGSYAGDARIDDVPPGQERLLSYGIDQQIQVDATKNRNESAIVTGKIVKGVLQLSFRDVFTQEYLAENKGDKDKTLVVEHPVRQGWKLLEPAKADETTEALYRFKGGVSAGKSTKLTVKQEHTRGEAIAILPADLGQLVFYARAGQIPKEVRDAITTAIAAKQAMVDTERQIQQRQQRMNEITQEQNRIRENMKTVAPNSDYYQRLLKKLDEQESGIEKLQVEVEGLQKKLDEQRAELENTLNNLNVG
jgi:hypothetical protein